MFDYADWEDRHFDAQHDVISADDPFLAPFDGYEDESDWHYAMQFDDREDDGWSERDDWADEEEFIASEDAFLDSYWEMVVEL